MTSLEDTEIIQARQLIDKGKFDETLTLLNEYEQKEGINKHNKSICHFLKGQILLWQGKLKELIKYAENLYLESKGRKSNLSILDNLLILIHALIRLRNFDKALELIKEGEDLIEIIPKSFSI